MASSPMAMAWMPRRVSQATASSGVLSDENTATIGSSRYCGK